MLLIATAPASGCGLIFNGYTQDLRVDSVPPGAKVLVTHSSEVYTTPVSIELPRDRGYVLYVWNDSGDVHTIEIAEGYGNVHFLDGFPPATGLGLIDVPVYWLTYTLGLPGYMIDGALGTNRGFEPDRVLVHLETGAVWTKDGDPAEGWPSPKQPPETQAGP